MIMSQILGKTYKTNQENGHYRSVYELKRCKKIVIPYTPRGMNSLLVNPYG